MTIQVHGRRVRRRKGSDAVEMITTSAMAMVLLAVMLMIILYVIQVMNVNFATKRCARLIETSGIVRLSSIHSIEEEFKQELGSTEFLVDRRLTFTPKYRVDGVTASGDEQIVFLGEFELTGEATYLVSIVQPGLYEGFRFKMPIKVTARGMTEVYFD